TRLTVQKLALGCKQALHQAPKESGCTFATKRLDRRCFQFLVELSNHPSLYTWHEPQQRATQVYFSCAGIKAKLWPSWVESQIHPLEQHGMSDKIRRYLQHPVAQH